LPKGQLSSVTLQTPQSLTFITLDDEGGVGAAPGDALIASVNQLQTNPASAAANLNAIFTDALKLDHAAFVINAAIINSAFPRFAAGLPADQIAPLFAATGPIPGFKPQYDAEIAGGATPGRAISDILKLMI
jgi:hypothetical protein